MGLRLQPWCMELQPGCSRALAAPELDPARFTARVISAMVQELGVRRWGASLP